MKFIKNKSKFRWGVTIVALVLSVITFSAVFLGVSSNDTTDELNRIDYALGTIDATTGKALDSKLAICTEDMNNIEGLEIEIVDEPTVTYQVFFYDEDKEYLSASESLSADYTAETVPEGAKYFRIVITPLEVDGEAVEINPLTMSKYTKQLTVTFDK